MGGRLVPVSQGVTQGAQGGSDTTPSTLVSFISGSTGPGWGRDPARPGAEPMKGQREELPSSPRNRQGEEGRENLFPTLRCQQDSLGLSPEQMEVGFPNQSHCNSPAVTTPAHGWEDCKAVQKTNLHRRLPETGLTLLVAPLPEQTVELLPAE